MTISKALKIIESNPMLKALDDWWRTEEKRRRKAISSTAKNSERRTGSL